MANPKVNILIANYNYGNWILDAFKSACEQTYPEISITIVDDGSTDDSWNKIYTTILKSRPHNKILPSNFDIRTCDYDYGKRSIPVTTVRLDKNYGPSFARNVGLSLGIDKHDYFMILDADDMMKQNKVWRCVEEAMKLPGMIGIVYADYSTINTETGLERIEYKSNFDYQKLLRNCIIHSQSLILKEALVQTAQNNEYYDSQLRVCEDYDLWLRITQKYLAYHIPESLSRVRVTPVNSSNTVSNDVRNACMNRIWQKLNVR